MIQFDDNFDPKPYHDMGIDIFDYLSLQGLLSIDNILKAQSMEDVKKSILFVANTLNSEGILPKQYKHLVKEYNKIDLVEPIFHKRQF